MNLYKLILLSYISITILGCKGKYGLENIDIGNAETFQVNRFENNAPLVESGLERNFKLALENLIQNQTKLNLVKSNGDLIYGGEIIEYRISPTTATTQNSAAQNRLTISIKVLFLNNLKKENNLEQIYSFFYDYPSSKQLIGGLKETAIKEILERISQDVFYKTLGNW